MKKFTLLLLLAVTLLVTSCRTAAINNYPGAIVTDMEKRNIGWFCIIKYQDQAYGGKWRYKKIWLTRYEYNNLKPGDIVR